MFQPLLLFGIFAFYLLMQSGYYPSEVRAINLDTEDGLVEAAMIGVADVPTIIVRKDGDEVARWGRKAPQSDELKAVLGL